MRSYLLSTSGLFALGIAGIGVMPGAALAQSPTSPPVQAEAAQTETSDAAQATETAADEGPLGDIVVTARRRGENLQEVPVAVTYASQERLRELGINNIVDLTRLAPGLQTDPSGTRQTFRPSIRGYSSSFGSSEASVIAYVAEVPNFPRQFFDLANIQVLKGPQGTLFGETAIGGAILFEPHRPENEFGGYVTLQGGNYDYRALEFAVGGAIVDDRILVRAAGQFRRRDGYVRAITSFQPNGYNLDNINTDQYRISLILRPSDNFENYTMYSRSDERSNGTGYAISLFLPRFINPAVRNVIPANTPATAARFQYFTGFAPTPGQTWAQLIDTAYRQQLAAGPFVNYLNFDTRGRSSARGIVNQTRWEISDAITIRNIFGMHWTKTYGNGANFDGTNLPLVDSPGLYYNPAFSQDRYVGGYPNRTWTNEIQALGNLFDNRLNWQLGFYYRDLNNREFQPTGGQPILSNTSGNPATAAVCASFGTTSPCTTFTRVVGSSRAFYGQVTGEITDEIRVTGGLRRTTDRRASISTAGPTVFVRSGGIDIPIGFIDQPVDPRALMTRTEVPTVSRTTYNLTADWRPTDDLMFYVTRRTGYKGGGINANAPIDAAFRTFGPESLTNTEFGAKVDFNIGGMRGRVNLAAFHDTYRDVQRSTVIPGQPLTAIQNIANLRNRGFELEATLIPAPWLELSGYVSIIDPRYQDWTENKTCATETYRPQCSGLPTTTPVIIDHSNGRLTINNVVTEFTPDVTGFTSRTRWNAQARLRFEPLIGHDVSLTTNVYYRSKWTITDAQYSIFAGTSAVPDSPGIYGVADPNGAPFIAGYTLVDLRAEWRNIMGRPISAAFGVTNLTNKLYASVTGNPLTICGCIGTAVGEPRMWTFELRYDF